MRGDVDQSLRERELRPSDESDTDESCAAHGALRVVQEAVDARNGELVRVVGDPEVACRAKGLSARDLSIARKELKPTVEPAERSQDLIRLGRAPCLKRKEKLGEERVSIGTLRTLLKGASAHQAERVSNNDSAIGPIRRDIVTLPSESDERDCSQ
jgi:hypothetical protein